MLSDSTLYCAYSLGTLFVCYKFWKYFAHKPSDATGERRSTSSNGPSANSQAIIPRKNVYVAYLLLFTGGGFWGHHHLYLGNYACGYLYMLTCGVFGMGPLYDTFTLWRQVRTINERNGANGDVDAKALNIFAKVVFKWVPLAFFLSVAAISVTAVYTPMILDRIGVVDLYAARAGIDKNPFDVLEVPRFSRFEVSKKNFRALSLKYHPDRNPNCVECAAKMADLNLAYDILKTMDDPGRPYDNYYDNCAKDWEALLTIMSRNFNSNEAEKNAKSSKRSKAKGKKKKEKESKMGMGEWIGDMLDKVVNDFSAYADEL